MSRHAALFLSHGAPDLLLSPGRTGALWRKLGESLPRPRGIVAISAHWGAELPTVSASPWPRTLHDFTGFPAPLYQMRYPAPGDAGLAARVADLLTHAGFTAGRHPDRGLDHGVWAPLALMYPAADIPVVQLSLVPREGAAWHLRLGASLQGLRDEGVLLLGSGSITHNFGWLSPPSSPPMPAAREFTEWLARGLAAGDHEALVDYRARAPGGADAHPTEEHLLPLFVIAGAAGPGEMPVRHETGYTYGSLAMDAYVWPGQGAATTREVGNGNL